jgi:hypothetical protein
MSMSDNGKQLSASDLLKGLNTKGDYAAALLGGSVGLLLDLTFFGLPAGPVTVASMAGAVGMKRTFEALGEKRQLVKKCRELEAYYRSERDLNRADRMAALNRKIEAVTSMTADEIKNEMAQIREGY